MSRALSLGLQTLRSRNLISVFCLGVFAHGNHMKPVFAQASFPCSISERWRVCSPLTVFQRLIACAKNSLQRVIRCPAHVKRAQSERFTFFVCSAGQRRPELVAQLQLHGPQHAARGAARRPRPGPCTVMRAPRSCTAHQHINTSSIHQSAAYLVTDVCVCAM